MSAPALNVSPMTVDKRRATDVAYGACYGIVLFMMIIIVAVGAANHNFSELTNPPSFCTDPIGSSSTAPPPPPDSVSTANLTAAWVEDLTNSTPWLAFAAFLALVMGVIWMAALKTCARPVVYATILLIGFLMGAQIIYLISIGASGGVPFLMFILALYFAVLWCYRSKINLTAVLIEQSVKVVQDHPGIFSASALLLTAAVIIYLAIFTGWMFLLANGSWQLQQNETTGLNECHWVLYDMTPLGLIIVSFCALWTWELSMGLRFYVVSFTTGSWYFQNAAVQGETDSNGLRNGLRNPVSMGLQLAFTKSFGTIAYFGLIMAIVQMLRDMARRSARNNGLAGLLVACCIQCIINCIEFISRFALTFHALTGDDFCTSARTFTDHLGKHGFTAIVVDWIARMVLQFGAFVMSLLVCAITVVITWRSLPAPETDEEHLNMVLTLVVMGFLSWFIAAFLLNFIVGILLNVIDAAYCCLVLDLDYGAQNRPELAMAIVTIVNPTYVIEQPNGQLAITNNQQGAQQPQVVTTAGQPVYQNQQVPVAYAQPTAYAQPPTAYAQPMAMAQPVVQYPPGSQPYQPAAPPKC